MMKIRFVSAFTLLLAIVPIGLGAGRRMELPVDRREIPVEGELRYIPNLPVVDTDPRTEGVLSSNHDGFGELLELDSPQVREELRRRLKERKFSFELRLLYAGVLAYWGDSDGQRFLIKRGYAANEETETKSVFWVIGHLDWFRSWETRDEQPKPDMRWAEEFMRDMVAKPKWLRAPKTHEGRRSRQSLAIDGGVGGFGDLLAEMKSRDLHTSLISLYEKDLEDLRDASLLHAFVLLEDRRTIPFLLRVLERHEDSSYGRAAAALARMRCAEAVPVLLKNLDDYETYTPLAEFRDDPRVLPALRAALPGLKDYARGEARLMLIDLEGGDRLPRLIELAQDLHHKSMTDVFSAIEKLHDERAIPFALEELQGAPRLYERYCAISLLATFSTPEAIAGLIDGLGIDFQAVARGKETMEDNNASYRARISDQLKRITGQDFGDDTDAWRKWFESWCGAFRSPNLRR